jgi:hypothetical protein
VDTARGADDDLRAILDGLDVVTDSSATNASVGIDVHEITDSNDDLLDLLRQLTSGSKDESLAFLELRVNVLKNGDGECGSFASTGLGLGDNVATFPMLAERTFSHRWKRLLPWMTGMIARCWIADGRSKP